MKTKLIALQTWLYGLPLWAQTIVGLLAFCTFPIVLPLLLLALVADIGFEGLNRVISAITSNDDDEYHG